MRARISNESTFQLDTSTIAENTATHDGGGIRLRSGYKHSTEISRSTISGNTADRHGGGVFVELPNYTAGYLEEYSGTHGR